MREIQKNDVVQFNERHKWCGCLGIVDSIKEFPGMRKRIMIGIPVPEKGTAYIFAEPEDLELIGEAVLMQSWEEDHE